MPRPTSLSHCLSLIHEVVPEDAATLVKDIPQEQILQALYATGTASIRHRKLPAEQMVWLCIGLSLFRHLPIVQIVDQLGLGAAEGPPVVKSAIHQARARLGPLPLLWLFQATAQKWAHDSARENAWRGLRLYGVDGTTLRVADSKENREYFGGTETPRGKSGYPLCRLVALMALRSHLLAAAAFGPYETGELGYAEALWEELPDSSLLIGDRGFVSAWVMWTLQTSGSNRQWLIRGKKNLSLRTVQRLGPGDELVEMKVSREAKAKHPELPAVILCRRIVYQRKGYRPQTLLTSLCDKSAYPKAEVVALYHERWEVELGYDEVKTELLSREETLRSRSPELVEQELWGTLLAYNLVRLEMERIAALMGVEPVQLSFAGTLMMLIQLWQLISLRYPGSIVKIVRSVEAQMQRLLLPPRRSHRNFPRAVKIKMSNYPRKRPTSPTKKALN
jgi:hypothetical protein